MDTSHHQHPGNPRVAEAHEASGGGVSHCDSPFLGLGGGSTAQRAAAWCGGFFLALALVGTCQGFDRYTLMKMVRSYEHGEKIRSFT